eukprot:GFUD01054589.1.p1 GENE.GFUD01054589.1~~GFUD01054589.1.p1  ORF type:complete len:138 (+),score=36.22 GFUD01054589.1:103-516(+)
MGKFDGKYVMESHHDLAACMMALGMCEEQSQNMADPKNMMTTTVSENDGSFTLITEHSMATEFNSTTTVKIGDTTVIQTPFQCVVTGTKKNENTWTFRTEMGGKILNQECQFHTHGLSLTGTVEGTAVSLREEFRKV